MCGGVVDQQRFVCAGATISIITVIALLHRLEQPPLLARPPTLALLLLLRPLPTLLLLASPALFPREYLNLLQPSLLASITRPCYESL